jgi:hypothetical protein
MSNLLNKKKYSQFLRYFTLHEVDDKSVTMGNVKIKDYQTPLDAAKKLFSSYCRSKDIKSDQNNKVNIKFFIRETTRGNSKVYGPYKGKFVKYDKPLKLKTITTIKIFGKSDVKRYNNKITQKGGSNEKIKIETNEDLKLLIKTVNTKYVIKNLGEDKKKILDKYNIEYNINIPQSSVKRIFNNLNKRNIENYNTVKYNIKLSDLDVSEITDMSYLFENFNFKDYLCNDVDISNWNVSKVNNMSYMFLNSIGFNQNLSNWSEKLDNIRSMEAMFSNCADFDSDLVWKINNSEPINFFRIFAGCTKIVITSLTKPILENTLNDKIKIYYNIITSNRYNKIVTLTKLTFPYGTIENMRKLYSRYTK